MSMNIQNAVIVAPTISDFYFTPGRAKALGAISVENQLIKMGIETTFLNLPLLNPRGKNINLPLSYNHLKPFLIKGENGPLSFFSSYKQFGPSCEESAEIILDTHPDIIFFSLFAWTYSEDLINLVKSIRDIEQSPIPVRICIGGPGVAVLPEYFQQSGLFDFIITGDAEEVIPSLIRSLSNENNNLVQVPHLFGIKGGNNTISQLPPEPAVSFNTDSRGKQWLSIILSRGCPLFCQFCSNFLTQGRRFRCTPVDKLKSALENLPVNPAETIHINLEDDNLLVRKSYFTEVLLMMKELFPLASFSIDNGLDYTNMSLDFIDFLIKTGFTSFTLSLGSSDVETLKKEKRPGNLKKLETILRSLKEKGIPVCTFLICGLPEDSKETILSSLLYLHSLPTDIGISLFYPVPGLPGFEDKQIFLNKSPSLCSGSSAYPWAESLSTKEMVTSFRLARYSNLLKKEKKSLNETELLQKIQSTKQLCSFQGKGKTIFEIPHLDESMVKNFLERAEALFSTTL